MVAGGGERPSVLPNGAGFAEVFGIDTGLRDAFFEYETRHLWPQACKVQLDTEGVDYLTPTPVQKAYVDAYGLHRWLMVCKYRQAKMTTIAVLMMLRDCMYLDGLKGLLIAESEKTGREVMETITRAYEELPPEARVPLKPGRKVGVEQLIFAHGGSIKILTMGGKSPAVGRGIDRLVITEFGEVAWQKEAMISILPAINRRPNARCTIESTPGKSGSHFETMWRAAVIHGEGRFHPLFFDWWRDPTCQADPRDVAGGLAAEDFEFMRRHEGMTPRNLAFRKKELPGFAYDERLFQSKYPSGPLEGWIGSENPELPAEVLGKMLAVAKEDGRVEGPGRCFEIEAPRRNRVYLTTADPTGYGETGDNAAATVWDIAAKKDVAFWEGREDPDVFAIRLRDMQARYNGAYLAVESNASGCIATLRALKTANLYLNNRHHPGWWCSESSKQVALTALVKMLREGDLELQSKGLVLQLMAWDGSTRQQRRRKAQDGTTSHLDRAMTALIAADLLNKKSFAGERLRAAEAAEKEEMAREEAALLAALPEHLRPPPAPRGIKASDLEKWERRFDGVSKNPYVRIPRTWM